LHARLRLRDLKVGGRLSVQKAFAIAFAEAPRVENPSSCLCK
jgi:hypothetical protein